MSRAKFELFRLSLTEAVQGDFFDGEHMTRERFLRLQFSRRWVFEHFKKQFAYVPFEQAASDDEEIILGRVGRERVVEENLPPSENLEDVEHRGWKASVVALDPTNHKDGQKLSFEAEREVGVPFSVLVSLVGHINKWTEGRPYHIEAQPIFDGGSFWSFADANKGQITQVRFDFSVPNGFWNTDKTLRDELAEVGHDTNAQTATTILSSQSGIDTESERVRDAVDFAEDGGGRVRAKTKTQKSYDSANKKETATLEYDSKGRPLIEVASAFTLRILGRE